MNKTSIKNFAVWARKKLRGDIKTRAGLIGITEDGVKEPLPASTREVQYFDVGSANPVMLTGKSIENRRKLVDKLKKDAEASTYEKAYDVMIEAMASLWFNRLAAIRYMEINDAFTDHLRVLSSTDPGSHDPDLVLMPFESNLVFSDQERERIIEWKTKNNNDRLFRFLLFRRCNQLQKVLPGLFEKKEDESELLMRLSFIDKDGLIYHLVHDIPEEDWRDQVQIIGWIYQYYNSELKDETFAKKGKISKEEIPAVTQLFTPDWIVRYMVENSLGRLWIDGHPDDALKQNWKYYLEEVEQEPDVQEQINNIRKDYSSFFPEDLTFIDPCMGSGHILVYAFDVLMQIYESQGYMPSDAVQSILENNLYGLDIDDRAYQLAYFAVMMKAMQYDKQILSRGIKPHIYAIQESNDVKRYQLKYLGAGMNEFEKNNALNQLTGLLDTMIDAKERGSIINVDQCDWDLLRRFVEGYNEIGQMEFDAVGIDKTQEKLQKLINIGEVIAKKYHVVSTNPPYLAVNNVGNKLNTYVKKHFPAEKVDLYSIFITRCRRMTIPNGFQAMITQHGWMFLGSFESMRKNTLNYNIVNMAHLGARAFDEIGGEVVQTTTFIIRNNNMTDYIGRFSRLVDGMSQNEKEEMFLSRRYEYFSPIQKFKNIPGSPIAYWISEGLTSAFSGKLLGDYADTKQGFATGDNERFLRLWFETSAKKTATILMNKCDAESSSYKWFPCTKGGSYRKWYGNHNYVANWEKNGIEMAAFKGSVIRNPQYYFREGISWSSLANKLSLRYTPQGFVFESKGSMCYPKGQLNIKYIMALLNSKVASEALKVLSPTLDFHEGPMAKVPIIVSENVDSIIELTDICIDIARQDWDSMETSWDFKMHPLVIESFRRKQDNSDCTTIDSCYSSWSYKCDERFAQLKATEEKINRSFINLYNLQDDLTEEVDEEDISVRRADLLRDMKSLLSYAVGCMFGRYSLDINGVVLAGGDWDTTKYKTFLPDKDNIIPITDSNRFEDDIVERLVEFIRITFGEDTLENNLQFIADALRIQGESSREVIRKYFLNNFFKDHCNTYSVTGSGKRPIYWLFDSGKQNGFKALVYMHRWNAETITRVRALYLHPTQEKYENEVRAIEAMMQSSSNNRQKAVWEKQREKLLKQIEEIKEYDEKIEHLSEEKIDIDLDDGVKRNYEKVQTDRNGKKFRILADIK